MKKRMLITGASQGIGLACANYFKDIYELTTVARNGEVSIKGDLTDQAFLVKLVESNPIDILINCAGIISPDLLETYNLNVTACSFLAAQYYNRMEFGHIINLCSIASYLTGSPNLSMQRLWYISSKRALKDFGVVLQNAKKRNVKVTNLEPGWVNTDIINEKIDVPSSEYRQQTREIIPLRPEDIAMAIEWILNQPQHIVINTLQIDNFRLVSNSL